jgi:DNA-directed RNA polymerase specialized sigma24 family protein
VTIAADDVARAVSATPAPLAARLVPFRPQVHRHILAMVRDPAEAEEPTQDTYARALARSAQLRDPQAALAWLCFIASSVNFAVRHEPQITVGEASRVAAG